MEFDGHIIGTSFASGHRIVVGRWLRSPFGSFADVMWCRPDGRRVLLAPDEPVRDFLATHYAFDECHVEPPTVGRRRDGSIEVAAGPVRLVVGLRPPSTASWLIALRPRRLRTRRSWIGLEDHLARPLTQAVFGARHVRTAGLTRAGAREWYAIHAYRTVEAKAWVDGADLGPVGPCPPARFGFSEAPSTPAIVRVTSIFDLADAGRVPGGANPA